MCDHCAVMYAGELVEYGTVEEIFDNPKHPYTKALLQSVFDIHMDFSKPIEPLEGEVNGATGEQKGCPFQNRCAYCMKKCQEEKPELKTVGEKHELACHLKNTNL